MRREAPSAQVAVVDLGGREGARAVGTEADVLDVQDRGPGEVNGHTRAGAEGVVAAAAVDGARDRAGGGIIHGVVARAAGDGHAHAAAADRGAVAVVTQHDDRGAAGDEGGYWRPSRKVQGGRAWGRWRREIVLLVVVLFVPPAEGVRGPLGVECPGPLSLALPLVLALPLALTIVASDLAYVEHRALGEIQLRALLGRQVCRGLGGQLGRSLGGQGHGQGLLRGCGFCCGLGGQLRCGLGFQAGLGGGVGSGLGSGVGSGLGSGVPGLGSSLGIGLGGSGGSLRGCCRSGLGGGIGSGLGRGVLGVLDHLVGGALLGAGGDGVRGRALLDAGGGQGVVVLEFLGGHDQDRASAELAHLDLDAGLGQDLEGPAAQRLDDDGLAVEDHDQVVLAAAVGRDGVRCFRAADADGGQRALHLEGFGVLLDDLAGDGAEGALGHLEEHLAGALAGVKDVLVQADLGALADVQDGLVEELDGPGRTLGRGQGVALEYRVAFGQGARTLRTAGRHLAFDNLGNANLLGHGTRSSTCTPQLPAWARIVTLQAMILDQHNNH